jgi:hypothetical protein
MHTNVKVMQVNNINITKENLTSGNNSSFDITFNQDRLVNPTSGEFSQFQSPDSDMDSLDSGSLKMPKIKQRIMQPPWLPKGLYRKQKSIRRDNLNNSTIVIAQDPKLKADAIIKANKSLVNSPKSGYTKNNEGFRNRLKSMEPKINATAVKQKDADLLYNLEGGLDKHGERYTAHSQQSVHNAEMKKLEESKKWPEVVVNYHENSYGNNVKLYTLDDAESFPSEEEYENACYPEEDYENDNFESPEQLG